MATNSRIFRDITERRRIVYKEYSKGGPNTLPCGMSYSNETGCDL